MHLVEIKVFFCFSVRGGGKGRRSPMRVGYVCVPSAREGEEVVWGTKARRVCLGEGAKFLRS